MIRTFQEVGTNPVSEHRRFSDIQDVASLVLEQIDAGLVGQVGEFGFKSWRPRRRHAPFYEPCAVPGKARSQMAETT